MITATDEALTPAPEETYDEEALIERGRAFLAERAAKEAGRR